MLLVVISGLALSRTSLYLEQFSQSLSIDSSLIFSLYLELSLSQTLSISNKFLGPLRVRDVIFANVSFGGFKK